MDRTEVKAVVHEAVRETLLPFGIDIHDAESLRSFQSDLEYMRRSRRGAEQVAAWTKRSAIVLCVSGIAWAVVEGLRMGFFKNSP